MFESPHATNFCRMSTVQWCSSLVIQEHSVRILSFWWVLLVWWEFRHFDLIHHWCDGWCDNWFEVFCKLLHFLISVGFNCDFHLSNFSSDLLSIFFLLLASLILRYEGQYHIIRTMVIIWCNMEQMSINGKISHWWNQCVQNVICVGEVWDIGD